MVELQDLLNIDSYVFNSEILREKSVKCSKYIQNVNVSLLTSTLIFKYLNERYKYKDRGIYEMTKLKYTNR